LSHERESVLAELVSAARWALSLGLYGGILLGLSYAVRKKIFAPAAILCIMLLTVIFVYGIGRLVENQGSLPFAKTQAVPLGSPGLILANTVRPAGTVLVLLQGPADPGKRVVATPGKPLQYQAEFAGRDQSLISLPPVLFNDDTPWFLKSLAIDLRLNAENLQQRFSRGLWPFLEYAGPLIFFLCSLMFIFRMSAWPLANLFLGGLAFRGVLALETFLNTAEIQDVIGSFLQNILPVSTIAPLIFLGVGILVYLYSFLVHLSKKQVDYAN
jgi:hypothetical protein